MLANEKNGLERVFAYSPYRMALSINWKHSDHASPCRWWPPAYALLATGTINSSMY